MIRDGFGSASDDDSVIEATKLLIRREGIIPALESSHAFAGLIGEADQIGEEKSYW